MTDSHVFDRWHNVLPADHTRVVLSPKVRPNTDYINANHVIVPESGRAYILSQGPLEETVPDFWAMIWQQVWSPNNRVYECFEE